MLSHAALYSSLLYLCSRAQTTSEALLMCPACCRWHLAVLGWKDGPGYLYNGLALLLSFIVSRVILYGLGLLHLLKLRYVAMATMTLGCYQHLS